MPTAVESPRRRHDSGVVPEGDRRRCGRRLDRQDPHRDSSAIGRCIQVPRGRSVIVRTPVPSTDKRTNKTSSPNACSTASPHSTTSTASVDSAGRSRSSTSADDPTRYMSACTMGSSPRYRLTSTNVGLTTGSSTPRPSPIPPANTVLPAPRSPARRITSPARRRLAKRRPTPLLPVDHAADQGEVRPHLGELLFATTQSRRRVECGDEVPMPPRVDLPSQPGDADVPPEKQLGGEVAERDDHLGIDQLELLTQVALARLDLVGERVTVSRRSAFEDVGDVHLIAPQTDLFEQTLQQLPGSSDEGQAPLVLVEPRRLADEHHLRIRVAVTEDHRGAARGESAHGAHRCDRRQLPQFLVPRHLSSIAAMPPIGVAALIAASIARLVATNVALPMPSGSAGFSPQDTAKAASPSYRV